MKVLTIALDKCAVIDRLVEEAHEKQVDVYEHLITQLTDIRTEEITEDMRRSMKTVGFAYLYGLPPEEAALKLGGLLAAPRPVTPKENPTPRGPYQSGREGSRRAMRDRAAFRR